jgi:hypothetical protein
LAEGAVFRAVVLDVGDPPFANLNGMEDERVALAAVVSDPVHADYEAILAGRDELGCACTLMAGARNELRSNRVENLTGLVGAASARRLAPPKEAAFDASPLGIRAEQLNEL